MKFNRVLLTALFIDILEVILLIVLLAIDIMVGIIYAVSVSTIDITYVLTYWYLSDKFEEE